MYEPITVEVDRAYGEGKYHSYTIFFIGRLIQIVEAGHTAMRLYGWADLGRLLYLDQSRRTKLGGLPCYLYPFSSTPTPPGGQGIHRRGSVSGRPRNRR